MRPSISPCYVVGNPIDRVRWRVRLKDSGPMVIQGIYWRADFPTDRLKELCKISQSNNWKYDHGKKQFVRRAGCQDQDGFRSAVVEEIKRLMVELSEKQKHGLDRVRRGMNPSKRKIAQTSHELTPSVQSWKYCTDFKVRFEGMMKSAQSWDAEQREAVKENIENMESFLAGLKRNLPT